ncbi:ABC transporter ATP-binding protein [Corynebacterium diphtheriae]|nr:ABC transporter ATP-binding protein [Corynebacterium diphtheriae]
MKQRIGVAAALLGNPQHLILDEPVNGLDPEGVSWMRNTIRDLASQGRSVLVSSHLLSEMQQTADRLVVIGKGKMIGEYTMSEFLSDGTTVLVESPQAAQLCDALKNRGLAAAVQDTQVVIALENADDDPAVRAQVAALALEYGIAVTRLETHQENLEQRFLAATQSVQEYRTSNAGN